MTTATKAPPETGEEKQTWTLKEVEKQEATLAELREKLVDLADQEADLREAIASAVEAGEDPDDLRDELAEVRCLRDDLAGVEPVLAERIAERRRSALRAMAETRIRSIRKIIGGLAGEHERKVERAAKARDAYLEALTKVEETPVRQRYLRLEAEGLAAVFDLELGEMHPTVLVRPPSPGSRAHRPGQKPEPLWAKLRGLNLILPGALRVPVVPSGHRSIDDPAERALVAAQMLAKYWDEASPAPEILAEAGEIEAGGEEE